MAKKFMTKEEYDKLSAELKACKTTKRSEIIKKIEESKKLGVMSPEYEAARDAQAENENRIEELENTLKDVEPL